ncbi:MAG: VCBS repeat-containing protein [Verrucomicrobiota bacterium]
MSKKAILFTLLGLGIVAVLVLTNFGRNLPFLGPRVPVYTSEIPETRPERLDQVLLERFEGETMENILAALAAEKAAQSGASPIEAEQTPPDPLFESLPDAPFPFDKETVPRNQDWLTNYVTSMKREESTKPSPEEIWRFNLALSALNIEKDQLPASLRMEKAFTTESDTLKAKFSPREASLVPPFAIGNFDGMPDLEVLDQGGTRLSKVSPDASIAPLEGRGIRFAGSRLYPADFDRDGDLDVFLIRPEGFPNSLYENDGNGNFSDVAIELGLLSFNDTTAASWIDYDGDGLLDLLEGSSDHPLQLFHQTKGGSFQPVAWDLKLWVHKGVREIQTADLSGDGISDVFLGLDDQPDRLLISRPAASWDGWRFEDIIGLQGIAMAQNHELSFLDFNQDGATDLALYGTKESGESFFVIFANGGEEQFINATEALGFSGEEDITAVSVIDVDQDGYDDLYLGTPQLSLNRTFWNRSGVAFREITVATRGGYLDTPKRMQVVDLDLNGLKDLLYANEAGQIRWLEPQGSVAFTLKVVLSQPLPGGQLVATARDRDWILQTVTHTLKESAFASIGVGEADIVEKLTLLGPDRKTVLHEVEKVSPEETITIEVPAFSKTTPAAQAPGS